MTDNAVTFPGRIIFGRLHFDNGREPANCADVMSVSPWEPYELVSWGLGTRFSSQFPSLFSRQAFPGVPFGTAVAATLPAQIRSAVLRREAPIFTEDQVAALLCPVLDLIAREDRILAGVPEPPSADPVYQRFSPPMLHRWRYVAGEDVAEPLVLGAVRYLNLRLFTPGEFMFVESCGGRLRPMPTAEDRAAITYQTGAEGRPSSKHIFYPYFQSRIASGKALRSVKQEAAHIAEWLVREHPEAAPATAKTIENAIREEYRATCSRPNSAPK